MIRNIKAIINKTKLKYKNSYKVFKVSIWFVCITITDKAIGILSEPRINRIKTTEEIGIFNVYTTWRSLLIIVVTFNLFCGVLEVLITREKEKEKK